LDRLDQSNLPLDNKPYNPKYNGSGVTVFVLDSGYTLNHPEYINGSRTGRISCGIDLVVNNASLPPCHDIFGHGTMVAGLVNGRISGVAKGADIVSVRIGRSLQKVDDFPTVATMLAGIEWVTNQKRVHYRTRPTVAVISIGFDVNEYIFSTTTLLDIALERMIDANVSTVVGAGNDYMDACGVTPARVPFAITVGGTTWNDTVWEYSNYGPCVNIFAPGERLVVSK
jgi:serine protease